MLNMCLGEWHFAKDKRTHLHFKYKHVKANVAVARDLFDYVCFLDPLPDPCVEAGSTSTKCYELIMIFVILSLSSMY